MDLLEECRQRRDRALNAWRREAQRLGELAKARRALPADLETQKKAVGEARELYDLLNDEYLNRIHGAKFAPDAKHADEVVH